MVFSCKSGNTILLRKIDQSIPHLWIVLTEPEGDPLQVVIVNLTTKRSGSDETVVLKVGAHPFIKHETCVNYSDAQIVKVEALMRAATSGFFDIPDAMDSAVLSAIQQGLLESPLTPRKIKSFCREKFGTA